jgi:hypothetical protein
MTVFAKPEKPRIVGRSGRGFLCTGSLAYGIGLTAKEAYMHWKTMVQVRAMRAK